MKTVHSPTFDTGIFTISLDFELIWGTLDLFGPERFREICVQERIVVERLLELFAEFDVPATWCTVGHLFLRECSEHGGVKHPEVVPPEHAWVSNDWFAHDPCGNETTDPVFYGRALIEKILACPVPQELGCHTFSHAIFGDPGCSKATARTELAQCLEVARRMGVEMRSFVFPRNKAGHLDLLPEFGFTCYRSREPRWYETWPDIVKRVGHLFDVLAATEPPVSLPQWDENGLWHTPASMLYFPMKGNRRHFVPVSVRVRRARKGLDAAVRQKRVFHLWFHPTDMAEEVDRMFSGLRLILEYARSLRERGELEMLPMGALVPQMELAR